MAFRRSASLPLPAGIPSSASAAAINAPTAFATSDRIIIWRCLARFNRSTFPAGIFYLLLEHAEGLTEINQGGSLVSKFEADFLNVARILATAILEIRNRYFLQGSSLVPGEL